MGAEEAQAEIFSIIREASIVMARKIFTGQGSGHFVTFGTLGRRSLLASPRARQVVISQLGKLAGQGRVKV